MSQDDAGKNEKLAPSTKRLSKKHHKDSFKFNLRHAKDHLDEAAKHARRMRQAGDTVRVPKSLTQAMRKVKAC